MSKAILLSIHPKWAKKIYSGEKRVEWRKSYPKIEGKTRVYMYETAPIKRVTGFFTLLDVEGVDVNKSITLSYEKGCVSIDDLKKYQGDSMCVFAWEIKHGSVVMFDQPKTLADFGLKRPPQSWQYVEKKMINTEVQKLIDSGIGVRQAYRKIENAKRAQEGKPKFDYDRETPKGEWV